MTTQETDNDVVLLTKRVPPVAAQPTPDIVPMVPWWTQLWRFLMMGGDD